MKYFVTKLLLGSHSTADELHSCSLLMSNVHTSSNHIIAAC